MPSGRQRKRLAYSDVAVAVRYRHQCALRKGFPVVRMPPLDTMIRIGHPENDIILMERSLRCLLCLRVDDFYHSLSEIEKPLKIIRRVNWTTKRKVRSREDQNESSKSYTYIVDTDSQHLPASYSEVCVKSPVLHLIASETTMLSFDRTLNARTMIYLSATKSVNES